MFLSPSAGRGWVPHSVGVSGTVTQRRVLVLGFPWLTHPQPGWLRLSLGRSCL